MSGKMRAFAAATVVLMMGLTAGCSGAEGGDAGAAGGGGSIVDVRTPAEFVEGHLQGAVNIDVQGSDFAQRVAALDKATTYKVYCRSGNRSAQAVAAMKQAGLSHVEDLGGISAAASATGLAIVAG